MYTNHEITKEEHLSWFERTSKDNTKRYFIFELNSRPCGVIGFVDINIQSKSSSWAFYSGDTSIRGIGSLMEIAALDYAFNEMKLEKLYCEVLEFNDAVIKFHKKHGFQQEGIFKKHHFSDGRFWDVHRLAIFKNDWTKCRNYLVNRIKGPYSCGKEYRHQFRVTSEQVVGFADITGDHNKVHFDDEYARSCGFEDKLVHGFLVTSVFSKVFGTIFPGDGTIYMKQSFSFQLPVYVDTELEACFEIISKIGRKLIVKTSIINQKTSEIVVDGEADVLISKEKSLEIVNE
jgi:UDP-4-amino-4,6-dideoxy-N-acetyl-beta-L-altrosamine N-acetyltransferase